MGSFKTKAVFSVFSILMLSLFIAGCGKDGYGTKSNNNNPPSQNPPANTIIISNFAFSPSSFSASAGDTVTWRNDDSVGHTVTSDSGNELNSPLLSPGQTYTHVFTSSGTFPYHCTVHPGMTASVTVQ